MSTSVFSLILSALLPVLVTFGLGFIAGRCQHFTADHARAFNQLVLLYTLPLSLFAGMLHTPRHVLMSMGPQSLLLALALCMSCLVPWLFMRWGLRLSIMDCTLLALVIGTPGVLFIGLPVLGPLVGAASTLLIVVAGLTQNLIVLPICLILLSMARPSSATVPLLTHMWHVARQPMVWAPLIAFALVLTGVQLPQCLIDSTRLLGLATGGLAMFAAGVVLQSRQVTFTPMALWPVLVRNILIPGACYGALTTISADVSVVQQIVLTMAIPTGSIALIVAIQFKAREREVASAVAISTLTSLVTMGGFVAMTAHPQAH